MERKTPELDFINAVNLERVKTLYAAANTHGLLSSFLVIAFFPFFMWSRVDHDLLIGWTLLISTVNIVRTLLAKQFRSRLQRNEITEDNALRWEAYFVSGIIITALVWSLTIFFPFTTEVFASMLYVLLIHVGANAAIVSMYMASKNTMLAYLTITLIPGFSRVAWEAQGPHIIIGLLGLVFLSIMVRSIYSHSSNLIDNIKLKLINEELSKKDALTGLWNRRQLYAFVDKLVPAGNRHSLTFSLLLADIDFFKKYNDSKGHAAGDNLLKSVAQIISTNIRSEDLAVRYGGEEFLIIFVGMGLSKAKEIAERLRVAVKEETDVTISSGLVEFKAGVDFDVLTKQADQLLYEAKHSGRDTICVAEDMNSGPPADS